MLLLNHLKRHGIFSRIPIAAAASSMIIAAVSYLMWTIPPALVVIIIDYARPSSDQRLTNLCVFLALAVTIAAESLKVLSKHLGKIASKEVASQISKNIFEFAISKTIKSDSDSTRGNLAEIISGDSETTAAFLMQEIPTAAAEAIRTMAILLLLYLINPALAIIAFAPFVLRSLEDRITSKQRARHLLYEANAKKALEKRICERLEALDSINSLSQQESETASIEILLQRLENTAINASITKHLQSILKSPAMILWCIITAWYISSSATNTEMPIGAVIASAIYIVQILFPLGSMERCILAYKDFRGATLRISNALPEETSSITNEASISFSNYEDNESKISGFDEIKLISPGITAIVGFSKNHEHYIVSKLLHDMPDGNRAVIVKDSEISEIQLGKVGGKLGFISQKAALFDGSIIENILYGNQEKERGDAIRAAQLAGLADLAEKLPGGYDSEVGQGGSLLSTAERRLVLIARTVLRNPEIIIFQEPDHPADPKSECLLYEAMTSIARTKGVIVFAERLSTVRTADDIIYMQNGAVAERGSFENLLAKKGVFHDYAANHFGNEASFRHDLRIELERNTRYGSKFSLVALRLSKECSESAPLHAVASAIATLIRIVDSSAQVGNNTILILLPEIDSPHLLQFFSRIKSSLPTKLADITGKQSISPDKILITGSCISKKVTRTPNEIINSIIKFCDTDNLENPEGLIPEEFLSTEKNI